MKKLLTLLAVIAILTASGSCGPKVSRPPAVDLSEYDRIGIITFTSNVEGGTLVSRFPEMRILVPGSEMRNRRPFAYVVAQDDQVWLNFVNTWVTLKRTEGFFDGLNRRWLGQS